MSTKYKKLFFLGIGLIALSSNPSKSEAQLNPATTSYFLNQYAFNPSIAGSTREFNFNVGYNNSLTGSNGKSLSNFASGDYGLGKSGVGLGVSTDKDGLIHVNKYYGTYAYHLKTSDHAKLDFGLNFGVTTYRVSTGDIIGDADDLAVADYNNQKPFIDADFGSSYTFKKLNVQVVLPNLRRLFNDDTGETSYDYATYYTSLSYKLLEGDIDLEPKIILRGIKNYGSIVDAGINIGFFDQKFNLQALYHSTQNVSAGIGLKFQKKYQFQISYSAPINTNIQKYTYGTVDIGIKLNLFNQE